MITFYDLIIYPILYILPAYVANGAPVLFGGGMPLDLGKKIGGKRILGDHKTIKGLIAGICSGIIIGFVESQYLPYMLLVGIALSIGTHFGDLIGSFVKRRLGLKPGASAFLLDQYTFVVFALLFASPIGQMPDVYGIIFILIITGILHKLTNMGAHMLRLKNVSW